MDPALKEYLDSMWDELKAANTKLEQKLEAQSAQLRYLLDTTDGVVGPVPASSSTAKLVTAAAVATDVPVLAASAASAKPLDIDTTGVVPPMPTTRSTKCPSRDATASTSVFTMDTTPTSATTTVDVTPVLAAPVATNNFAAPSRPLQAAVPALILELRVLRPMPWPSFKYHSEAVYSEEPIQLMLPGIGMCWTYVQSVPPRSPNPWKNFWEEHRFLLSGRNDLEAEMLLSPSGSSCTVGHLQEVNLSCLFNWMSVSWQWLVRWLGYGVELRPIPWPSFPNDVPSDVCCSSVTNGDPQETNYADDIHPWKCLEHPFLIIHMHDSGWTSSYLSEKLFNIGGLGYNLLRHCIRIPPGQMQMTTACSTWQLFLSGSSPILLKTTATTTLYTLEWMGYSLAAKFSVFHQQILMGFQMASSTPDQLSVFAMTRSCSLELLPALGVCRAVHYDLSSSLFTTIIDVPKCVMGTSNLGRIWDPGGLLLGVPYPVSVRVQAPIPGGRPGMDALITATFKGTCLDSIPLCVENAIMPTHVDVDLVDSLHLDTGQVALSTSSNHLQEETYIKAGHLNYSVVKCTPDASHYGGEGKELARASPIWLVAWTVDSLDFFMGHGQAPSQGGRNVIPLAFSDHVQVSCGYYLDQAHYFDTNSSDIIYYHEDYYGDSTKTKETHMPWDPGKLVLCYRPKLRLGDKPNFKEGGMLGTSPAYN